MSVNFRKWQKKLSRLLALYAALYTGFGFFILLGEKILFHLLNSLQSFLRMGTPISEPVEPFWKFVSISLLWMLGILCWWAKTDVAANKKLVQLMIYCKFFSAFLMLVWFAVAGGITPYLVGGLTDFTLGAIALAFFLKAFPGSLGDFICLSPGNRRTE